MGCHEFYGARRSPTFDISPCQASVATLDLSLIVSVSPWSLVDTAYLEGNALSEALPALLCVSAGQLLVLSIIVVLAGSWFGRRDGRAYRPQSRQSTQPRRVPRNLASSRDLEVALESATSLNSFDVGSLHDPVLRLHTVVRFEPRSYSSALVEVSQCYREGRVLSVDLRGMDQCNAVRLIDFCSGLAAATAGWIFRVADDVIVITPSTS